MNLDVACRGLDPNEHSTPHLSPTDTVLTVLFAHNCNCFCYNNEYDLIFLKCPYIDHLYIYANNATGRVVIIFVVKMYYCYSSISSRKCSEHS